MNHKIAILSTVVNFDLYRKSSLLFPEGIPKYVIDGRNGMHAMDSIVYMFRKLKGLDIDWLIMADEDVLFINSNLVFGMIERMEKGDITVCGVRDGGVIPHRIQNPHAINTFFSIINLKEIMKMWDANEVRKHQYVNKGEFKDDLSNLTSGYDAMSTFEPYYCFYFWLRRKGKKILFLEADMPFENDNIANRVKDDLGNDLLYHTWYARAYGNNEKHTKRIDAIFDKVGHSKANYTAPILFKDPAFATKKSVSKLYNRITGKIKSILKKN